MPVAKARVAALPKSVRWCDFNASFLEKQDNYDAAIAEYTRCQELDPDNFDNQLKFGAQIAALEEYKKRAEKRKQRTSASSFLRLTSEGEKLRASQRSNVGRQLFFFKHLAFGISPSATFANKLRQLRKRLVCAAHIDPSEEEHLATLFIAQGVYDTQTGEALMLVRPGQLRHEVAARQSTIGVCRRQRIHEIFAESQSESSEARAHQRLGRRRVADPVMKWRATVGTALARVACAIAFHVLGAAIRAA